jgi:hypothetical protein
LRVFMLQEEDNIAHTTVITETDSSHCHTKNGIVCGGTASHYKRIQTHILLSQYLMAFAKISSCGPMVNATVSHSRGIGIKSWTGDRLS